MVPEFVRAGGDTHECSADRALQELRVPLVDTVRSLGIDQRSVSLGDRPDIVVVVGQSPDVDLVRTGGGEREAKIDGLHG